MGNGCPKRKAQGYARATWIEQSGTFGTDYKFTGKELDKETGLYYFGARYYDPRTQVWQSPDPILSSYLDGKRGMGGVYNPVNLGLYTYAGNNPINIVDINGKWNEIGHHDVMFVAMYAAGFDATQSSFIARSAWAPDVDSRNAMSFTSLKQASQSSGHQQRVHLLNGGNPQIAQQTAGRVFETDLSYIKNGYLIGDDNNFLFENNAHRLGDAYAHINPDTGLLYNHTVGHAEHGTTPDSPYTNPVRFVDYAMDIYDRGVSVKGQPRISRSMYRSLMLDLTKIESTNNQHAFLENISKAMGTDLPQSQEGYGLLGTGNLLEGAF